LIAAVFGLLGLGVVGAGGYAFYRWVGLKKSVAVSQVQAPSVETNPSPGTTPVPEEPAPTATVAPPVTTPPPPVPATPKVPVVEQKVPVPAPKASIVAPTVPVVAPQTPPVVAAKTSPVPVPEPKPAPEAPATYGPPSPERKNTSNVSLSDAINLADSDPNRAIEGLRTAIAADPGNANAYAWLVAVLYGQGRYQEIPGVLAKARQNGIPRARLMANIRFRMAMQNDKLNHRIPGGSGGEE
jgi:outer membrane biosynthesis protein TonB